MVTYDNAIRNQSRLYMSLCLKKNCWIAESFPKTQDFANRKIYSSTLMCFLAIYFIQFETKTICFLNGGDLKYFTRDYKWNRRFFSKPNFFWKKEPVNHDEGGNFSPWTFMVKSCHQKLGWSKVGGAAERVAKTSTEIPLYSSSNSLMSMKTIQETIINFMKGNSNYAIQF